MQRHKFFALVALALLALVAAACAGAAPATTAPAAEPTAAPTTAPTTTGELWYNPEDVGETWYNICTDKPPVYGGTLTSNQAASALAGGANWFSYAAKDQYLWNQLFDLDVDGETIHPDLATSWDVSADGLVYTFHLRNDVKFHDGVQLTANDVAFTFKIFLHPDSAIPFGRILALDNILGAEEFIAGEAEEIEGIKVLDDFTLEVTLAHPVSNFLDKVRGVNIHPKHLLENIPYAELITSEYAKTKPVGSGPFKMGEYVPEQYYILEANEDYYAGRPYLDRIIFRIGLSGATALAALEAGEIQVASTSAAADYMRLKENPNIALVGGPLGGGLTIWPNLEREQWQDVRVRTAIAMAVDRQAIIDAYYGEYAQVLPTYLVGPQVNPDLEAIPYDPDQAKQLLNDAGWDWDYEIQFLSYYQSDFDKRVQSALQQAWQDIGLKVNIQYMDGPTWVDSVYNRYEFDLGYGCCGWVDPAAMAEAGCDQFFPAGYNVSRYCNQEFDDLVKQGYSEPDAAKRTELFNQAQAIFHEAQAYIPMFWPLRFHAVSANLCGYQNHQISEPWTEMYPNKWYLAQ